MIKKNIFKRLILIVKYSFQYVYVIKSFFIPIKIQKVCFFYLPEVPDFGNEFLYLKLGKKEEIRNTHNYNVIFEADLPDNVADLNSIFLDYSGLYALYRNNLITEDYLLLIHYDTKILHNKWKEIIKANVYKHNIVFSTWPIKKNPNEVGKWVNKRIQSAFWETHKKDFYSILQERNITVLPNSSQFACKKKVFYSLMDFLFPFYEYIKKRDDISFLYAHLMEKAWGTYFALHGYKTFAVIKDSHNQARNYLEKAKNYQ